MLNQEIYVKVMKIQYDLFRIRLTAKSASLNDHKSYLSKHQILQNYNLYEHVNFYIEKETDFPKVYIEPKVPRNFILRNIKWLNFKNYSS